MQVNAAEQSEIDEIANLTLELSEENDDISWINQLDLTGNSDNKSFNVVSNLDRNTDGFDENTGDSWIFPINFEKRDYQLNISKTALFQNTLLILPTGLGKTFIASVVIYNFYRWYPQSKIIFMAPTKPLVNQQMSACYDIVGIPKEETAELTGSAAKKEKRKELWNTKRVFFCTPQCIVSDIESNNLPANQIKLVVIDEAHKSKGDYAYCKVIKSIQNVHQNFRVLGLTATAGRTADIIQIIQNLLISKIEYRSEDSIDVRPYTHKKVFETVKVKLGDELQKIQEKFIKLVDPYIREIKDSGYGRVPSLSKGYLIIEQKRVKSNNFIPQEDRKKLLSTLSIAVGLYHSLELLERHGIHLFLKSLRDENNVHKYYVKKDPELRVFVTDLDKRYKDISPFQINSDPMPNGEIPSAVDKEIDFGHPKFDILKAKLLEYFNNNGSKTIIFCEFRDTASLIYTMLLKMKPLVLPRKLIGQGSDVTQKEQLKIMREFREGKANTLVCTCVAEEGLDIGDVDLVICFDINSKSATRFVQRIGRTARKRKGKIIVLASEGREEQMIKNLLSTKDAMNKSISRSKEIPKYFYKSSRLIPSAFTPKCVETKFSIEKSDTSEQSKKKPGRKKSEKMQNSKLKKPLPSITKHFKPISKEERLVEKKEDACEHVIEIRNDDFKNSIPIETINQSLRLKVSECLEKISDSEVYPEYYQHISEQCIARWNKFYQTIHTKTPKNPNYIKIGDDSLCMSSMSEDVSSSDGEQRVENKSSRCLDSQFFPSASYTPVVSNYLSPPKQQIESVPFENSPLSSAFKQQQMIVPASTPILKRPCSELCHLDEDVAETTKVEPQKKSAFDFLGITSVMDIFENCTNTEIDKCNQMDSQETPDIDIIESSLDHPLKSTLERFKLESYLDIFEPEEKVAEDPLQKYLNESTASDLSDITEIYDFDEEISKTVVTENQTDQSSQKENVDVIISPVKEPPSRPSQCKPNLSRLLSALNSGRFKAPAPKKPLQNNNENVRNVDRSPETPKSTRERLVSQSTPTLGNSSSDDERESALRKLPTRKKKMPKNRKHLSFIQTQAGVEGDASSDEEDIHNTSIADFVSNETVIHDQTSVYVNYLKSLQSPSARINRNFKIPKQLSPIANMSDIFSQLPEASDSESSNDSFVVGNDENSYESELDELDIIEMKLKENKKKRKLKSSGGQRGRRKIIRPNDSTDEELEKLRKELDGI